MLFQKRELLKGRTHKLETAVKALGLTVESDPPQTREADFPSRDVSPCTSEILDTPEESEFWDTYALALEEQDLPKLDLKSRELELMSYYKLDPVTRKPEPDPVTGMKKTTGEGTMQAVLKDLLDKSAEQYSRLNETRQQLTTLREELIDTVQDLNKRKGDLRLSLKDIEDLKAKIERLNGEIRQLNDQIAQLEEDKVVLEDEIAEQQRQMEMLQEEIQEKEATIAQLELKIQEGPPMGEETPRGPGEVTRPPTPTRVTPGEKGTVAAVSKDWNFAVLDLSDVFLRQLLGDDLAQPLPNIDLYIKRRGDPPTFVAKVRLIQVRADRKLGIADILPKWQQLPLKKGDLIFY